MSPMTYEELVLSALVFLCVLLLLLHEDSCGRTLV